MDSSHSLVPFTVKLNPIPALVHGGSLGEGWDGFEGMAKHFNIVSLLPHHPNVHWYMGTTIHSTWLDKNIELSPGTSPGRRCAGGGQDPSCTVVLGHMFSMFVWLSSHWWGWKGCDGWRDGKAPSNVSIVPHCPTTPRCMTLLCGICKM